MKIAAKAGLLILSLLPFLVGGLLALRLWLDPATTAQDWQQPIWPVVILYAISLFAFVGHALNNKSLGPGELDYWITRFFVMSVFGMIDYWRAYAANE